MVLGASEEESCWSATAIMQEATRPCRANHATAWLAHASRNSIDSETTLIYYPRSQRRALRAGNDARRHTGTYGPCPPTVTTSRRCPRSVAVRVLVAMLLPNYATDPCVPVPQTLVSPLHATRRIIAATGHGKQQPTHAMTTNNDGRAGMFSAMPAEFFFFPRGRT